MVAARPKSQAPRVPLAAAFHSCTRIGGGQGQQAWVTPIGFVVPSVGVVGMVSPL